MTRQKEFKVLIQFVLLISIVLAASYFSSTLWGGKPKEIKPSHTLLLKDSMTISEFGKENGIPMPVLKKVFQLNTKQDLNKTIGDFHISGDQITKSITKNMAVYSEDNSKNWIKILIKFSLWITFLTLTFILVRKNSVNVKNRKLLYIISILVFGVMLGSDPNPMGTIKDALVLFGESGAIFPPRLIALAIFLLMVFVANKFICSWGCQLGTLQDLIFRLNRNSKDTKGIFRQYKLPFALTNLIRVIFFVLLIMLAFIWAFDIVEVIDPFKVFNPKMIGIAGWVFVGFVLISSLFVYRPWCHLFCPFGLAGWLLEKIAAFKIHVDYKTCIACDACSKACPSNVMDAILKQDKVIPDCFSCGTCIEVCPTNSIQFLSKKREKVPEGKFEIKTIKSKV